VVVDPHLTHGIEVSALSATWCRLPHYFFLSSTTASFLSAYFFIRTVISETSKQQSVVVDMFVALMLIDSADVILGIPDFFQGQKSLKFHISLLTYRSVNKANQRKVS